MIWLAIEIVALVICLFSAHVTRKAHRAQQFFTDAIAAYNRHDVKTGDMLRKLGESELHRPWYRRRAAA